jgi:hypothetical protein
MSALAFTLVEDWNVYLMQTFHVHQMRAQGRYIGTRRPNAANVAMMDAMVEWCRGRAIEPRQWLFFLFKRTNWRFPPKWQEGYLMSEAAAKKFRKPAKYSLAFFRRRMGAAAVVDDAAYDPNRDITPATEALKARYAESGQQMRCLDETLVRTAGFHPQSRVCAACKLSQECALALEAAAPFAILALRSGIITSSEAERQAVLHD